MHNEAIEMMAFVHATPFAYVVLDERSNILAASQGIEDISGYAPEVLHGKTLSVLIPSDAPHPHNSSLHIYVAAPPKPLNPLSDVPLLRKDGSVVRVSVERYIYSYMGRLRFGGIVRLLDQNQAYPRATQD